MVDGEPACIVELLADLHPVLRVDLRDQASGPGLRAGHHMQILGADVLHGLLCRRRRGGRGLGPGRRKRFLPPSPPGEATTAASVDSLADLLGRSDTAAGSVFSNARRAMGSIELCCWMENWRWGSDGWKMEPIPPIPCVSARVCQRGGRGDFGGSLSSPAFPAHHRPLCTKRTGVRRRIWEESNSLRARMAAA